MIYGSMREEYKPVLDNVGKYGIISKSPWKIVFNIKDRIRVLLSFLHLFSAHRIDVNASLCVIPVKPVFITGMAEGDCSHSQLLLELWINWAGQTSRLLERQISAQGGVCRYTEMHWMEWDRDEECYSGFRNQIRHVLKILKLKSCGTGPVSVTHCLADLVCSSLINDDDESYLSSLHIG